MNSYFMKKIIIIILCIILNPLSTWALWARDNTPVVDAERNANFHNNLGLIHLRDRYYNAAIKEFNIAITLNPNHQTTASYYANLAKVYTIIGYPGIAQDALEKAIKQDKMNLLYYLELVDTYKTQKILPQKLKQYSQDRSNPLSQVMVGLIQIETGQESQGILTLQTFCYREPDLIITQGVQSYIEQRNKPRR